PIGAGENDYRLFGNLFAGNITGILTRQAEPQVTAAGDGLREEFPHGLVMEPLSFTVSRSEKRARNSKPVSDHKLAHPPGPFGFAAVTRSPSPGSPTNPCRCDCDSHTNKSRKRISRKARGGRTLICLSTSKFAPSTPTAKKANDFACSPVRTN